MTNKRSVLLLLIIALFISGCSMNDSANNHPDYEQTKKMIVDILKTDEGKKAIQDVMDDDQLKQRFVLEQPVVAETIENTLVSNKGREFWKKSFDDPKFAKSFAIGMKDEHEKLLKALLDDPTYRGKLIDILKDPEVEKDLTQLFKSKEYREYLQGVITETFENPIFQTKIQDILLKAAEDMQADTEKDKKKKKEDDTEKAMKDTG